MKQRGVFLIGLILMAIYYFLFPRGTGRELVLQPESLRLMNEISPVHRGTGPAVLGIHSGRNVVYLDDDGRTVHRQTGSDLAVDDDWWATEGPDGVDIRDPGGRLRSRIAVFARPISRNGSLYLYKSDLGSLSKVDPSNGRVLWSREFLSPVTVLDGRRERTLVGLLDGRFILLDAEGRVVQEFRPGGSRVEAIYGGALSSDGTKIALIAGLDPQRFILLEERKNGFRPVTHHSTETDFRRSVPVAFVRNDSLVLYESDGFVVALDTGHYQQRRLEVGGSPRVWIDIPDSSALAMLGEAGPKTMLLILTRHDLPIFDDRLPPDFVDIDMHQDRIYLVGDQRFGVMRIALR